MESKHRITALSISLIICISATVMLDFWLSRSGQGVFFKARLPKGITLEYDKVEGYKILEEGFIHIIDEHKIHGQDTIAAILAYYSSESNVFIKSRNTLGEIVFLNIHLLKSEKDEIKYELLNHRVSGNEDWIDISSRGSIRFVRTLRNMLVAIAVVLFTIQLFGWIISAYSRKV
ncbi:MAG TPA: hypothetical protein VGD65_06300 [Chryseosolibacter sp.]